MFLNYSTSIVEWAFSTLWKVLIWSRALCQIQHYTTIFIKTLDQLKFQITYTKYNAVTMVQNIW